MVLIYEPLQNNILNVFYLLIFYVCILFFQVKAGATSFDENNDLIWLKTLKPSSHHNTSTLFPYS